VDRGGGKLGVWLNKVSYFWRRLWIAGCGLGMSGGDGEGGRICSWKREERALVWTLRLTWECEEAFGLKGAAERIIGWPKWVKESDSFL